MIDCLWIGRLIQYITNHQINLSLPSLWGKYIEYWSVWLGLRWGTFTYVHYCPVIPYRKQVMLRSSKAGYH